MRLRGTMISIFIRERWERLSSPGTREIELADDDDVQFPYRSLFHHFSGKFIDAFVAVAIGGLSAVAYAKFERTVLL